MSSRYLEAARAAIESIAAAEIPGVGIVLCPPRQQAEVAEALLSSLPGFTAGALTESIIASGPSRFLATSIPDETESTRALFIELNGRRGWIETHGRSLVLLLDRYQLSELQRYAGDVYSAIRFLERVAFVPDPEVDFESARRSLVAWQDKRFGRLDLRGFIRSENEDGSWRVEEIYQTLNARIIKWPGENRIPTPVTSQSAIQSIQEFKGSAPVVVLGYPGAGKTFLLRWLALQAGRGDFMGFVRPIPILLSLSSYAQAPGPLSLRDFVIESLLIEGQPAAHFIDAAIANRSAMLLFDGLDEVGDTDARLRMSNSLQTLAREAHGCLVVATSRIAGFQDAPVDGIHLELSPLDDPAIRKFLLGWTALYSQSLRGNDEVSRQLAAKEGAQLADDVLGNIQVRDLARNPLLLTILAIIHRAGVRLPDHRVELYEHATKVLVERWNRVRSLHGERAPVPLKSADAVRLLGPVALDLVRSGARGAIPEERLRSLLAAQLELGNLRGLSTADEAINLFKGELGLLVEQGPKLYSFLHLTLAEYFAAWELVRTGELEKLAASTTQAFNPKWRESILLAAGELGIIRADDARLARLIGKLVKTAGKPTVKPSPSVPLLLAGLLADDPALTGILAQRLVDSLVPEWWFNRFAPPRHDAYSAATDATALIEERIRNGRFFNVLHERIQKHYFGEDGSTLERSVIQSFISSSRCCIEFLRAADVDEGRLIVQVLSCERSPVFIFLCDSPEVKWEKEKLVLNVPISRLAYEALRTGSPRARVKIQPLYFRRAGEAIDFPVVFDEAIFKDIQATRKLRDIGRWLVELEIELKIEDRFGEFVREGGGISNFWFLVTLTPAE